MDYRAFKNNERISLLGFGLMRLPRLGGSQSIDRGEASSMIARAIERGVNYFDTGYTYHDGDSELFAGQALGAYPRESYFLATKMPTWMVESKNDVNRIFEDQLRRCRTDHFDFYLVHCLNESNFKKCEDHSVYQTLKAYQEKGLIGRLGFSFHDSTALLRKILSAHEWDFAQIQLNYLDWEVQDAKTEYEILTSAGLPVIVMEPVRGGVLASLNAKARAILQNLRPNDSAASWAMRFAASLPGVVTVLSGMSTLEQLDDNIATLSAFEPLSEAERNALNEAKTAFNVSGGVPCTGCRYCMDCPSGVDIPRVFEVYNLYGIDKDPETLSSNYRLIPGGSRACECTGCGECAQKCPQRIDIPGLMKKIAPETANIK